MKKYIQLLLFIYYLKYPPPLQNNVGEEDFDSAGLQLSVDLLLQPICDKITTSFDHCKAN